MRKDKKKNVDMVSAYRAKNPLATECEVSKELWMSSWTVHRCFKEMEKNGEVKDERIIHLTDWDFDIMQKIQEIKKNRLEKPDDVSNKEVDLRENTATKRYSLFRWKATDNEWGMKDFSQISIITDEQDAWDKDDE